MSYPKIVVIAITCHGTIVINNETNEAETFNIPNKMKIIKLSAVTPGVCNFTVDDDVDKFIKTILDKEHRKRMDKQIKTPNTYVKTLANLYQNIEKETLIETIKASTDSNESIRKEYIHNLDKRYKIVNYNKKHPKMVNKLYTRNSKTEQNVSEWDFGIFALNVLGKPDLITLLKGRSYADNNVSVNLEEIIYYLKGKGVEQIILLDMSCSNFEYEDNTSVNERTTRSIRNNLLKQNLNGGRVNRKKRTIKQNDLLVGARRRKTISNRFHKNRKITITKKRKYFKNIKGAGKEEDEKREDMMKIMKVINQNYEKKEHRNFLYRLFTVFTAEQLHRVIINNEIDPNYLMNYLAKQGFTPDDNMDVNMQKFIDEMTPKTKSDQADYSDGTIEGETKNGKLEGQGKITYPDGTIVEGEFKDDLLNGNGRIFVSRENGGDVIEGEFKNNKLNGQGKWNSKTGRIIEGEFKDNLLNGKGKITYPDGSVIEGDWKNGYLNGKCKINYVSGRIYEGDCKHNMKKGVGEKNGLGKMRYPDGSVYEGSYKNDKRNGYGKFTDPADGTVYEGEWEDGQRHGQGKQSNAKGEIYEGSFKNGYRHGQGTMKYKGIVKTGTFYNDGYVKNAAGNI